MLFNACNIISCSSSNLVKPLFMDNLNFVVYTVDGGDLSNDEFTGKEVIESLFGDDWGAPPRSMEITAQTEDGKTVAISIPYADIGRASAHIRD